MLTERSQLREFLTLLALFRMYIAGRVVRASLPRKVKFDAVDVAVRVLYACCLTHFLTAGSRHSLITIVIYRDSASERVVMVRPLLPPLPVQKPLPAFRMPRRSRSRSVQGPPDESAPPFKNDRRARTIVST